MATFIDGVYMGRGNQSLVPFLDIAQVEVLKGPQPTYFGQNAIGGALLITTQQASESTPAYMNASVLSEDETSIEAAWGGSVTETLGIRLAVRDYRDEGWVKDKTSGDHWPERHLQAFRARAQWQPSEQMTLRLKAETVASRQSGSNLEVANCEASITASPGLCELLKNDTAVNWDDRVNNTSSLGGYRPVPVTSVHLNIFGDQVINDHTTNPLFQNLSRDLDSDLLVFFLERQWSGHQTK